MLPFIFVVSSLTPLPPRPTLFPYTTLFRSRASRTSFGMLACVIVAGWHRSDSTPPRLSARLNSFVLVMNDFAAGMRSEEHTSELQSLRHLVCRLLLEKKK